MHPAAAINRSISAVVRYSRVRTEEFIVLGADRRPLRFSTIFCPRSKTTGELSALLSSVNRSIWFPSRGPFCPRTNTGTGNQFGQPLAEPAQARALMIEFQRPRIRWEERPWSDYRLERLWRLIIVSNKANNGRRFSLHSFERKIFVHALG